MISLYALLLGFAFDLLLGDPPGFPHMVVGMGKLISLLESGLRRLFPGTAKGELYGGTVLAITLPLFSSGLAWGLLYLCSLIHPLARLLVESLLCWQCLALRSLCDASMKVYTALKEDNLPRARLALGQIVGRDTKNLDAAGVTRAAVETVAENTNDGVIAPLLFLLAGGAAFGVFYKAVNTMDSMIGYKNSRYLYFGRAAALLDDLINFIPARIAGLLILLPLISCSLTRAMPGAFFSATAIITQVPIPLRRNPPVPGHCISGSGAVPNTAVSLFTNPI